MPAERRHWQPNGLHPGTPLLRGALQKAAPLELLRPTALPCARLGYP